MASKNNVQYNAAQMEELIQNLMNSATALTATAERIAPPVVALTGEEYLSGPDTESYKECFRNVQASAEASRQILTKLRDTCKNVADAMGLAVKVVTKSASEAAADMQKSCTKVKESTGAK